MKRRLPSHRSEIKAIDHLFKQILGRLITGNDDWDKHDEELAEINARLSMLERRSARGWRRWRWFNIGILVFDLTMAHTLDHGWIALIMQTLGVTVVLMGAAFFRYNERSAAYTEE